MSASASEKVSALPKFTIGAGLIAASSIGVIHSDGMVSQGGTIGVPICPAYVENTHTDEKELVDSLQADISEDWSEEKHGPELRKLILKKAKACGKISKADAARLSKLQNMRRETLPLAMSYEEFIREYNRKIELQALIDALAEYKRKYETQVNA